MMALYAGEWLKQPLIAGYAVCVVEESSRLWLLYRDNNVATLVV